MFHEVEGSIPLLLNNIGGTRQCPVSGCLGGFVLFLAGSGFCLMVIGERVRRCLFGDLNSG